MNARKFTAIGKAMPIRDAVEKVTGRTRYTADLTLPGMLYGVVLTSPHAHARIVSIDATEAEAMPGVYAVLTCFNTPEFRYNSSSRFRGFGIHKNEQAFPRVMRYVGDRVAAVAAETEELAQEALKKLKIEYEILPAVLTCEDALKAGAPRIHDECEGNVLGSKKLGCGDVDKALAEADVVTETTMYMPKVCHCALEPHAALADWNGSKLTVWSAAQNIFGYRDLLAEMLNLPMNRVRVIRPPVGGGFGGKVEITLEPVIALLAVKCGRPVRLVYTRSQCFVSTRTRHRAHVTVTLGAKKDGTVTALRFKEVLDAGAYASGSTSILGAQCSKAFILYNVPNMEFDGMAVFTNTPMAGAMRGYGTQQIQTPLEHCMDKLAAALTINPVDLRRKNLYSPHDAHPVYGGTVGNCHSKEALERAQELFNAEPVGKAAGGKLRGWGFACGVHGNTPFPSSIDYTTVTVRVVPDGSVILYSGSQDLGQGSVSMLTQLVAEVLGIDSTAIEVVEADTETTSFDLGTYATRATWIAGRATKKAAEGMADMLKTEAAALLKVDKSELVLQDGCVVFASQPECRATLREVAFYAQQVSHSGELMAVGTHYAEGNAGSYGVHFAEIEVDTTTGKVDVLRYVAVHDVGTVINPLGLAGQVEGGIQMGLGYALSEEMELDENGKMKNAHFKRYHMFRSNQMPRIASDFVGGGERQGAFGAKGIGEATTVPVSAAILSALCNTVGADFTTLPVRPEAILAALKK